LRAFANNGIAKNRQMIFFIGLSFYVLYTRNPTTFNAIANFSVLELTQI
jgi:hypothetical protein